MLKSLPVLGLATLALTLGACTADSGDTGEDAAATSSSAAPKPPAVASEVILSSADAPAGYTYSDVAEVLAEGEGQEGHEDVIAILSELSGDNITSPAHCGALLPTAVDLLAQIEEEPQASAASEFADAEGNVISVLATTSDSWERTPANLDECTTFTRNASNLGADLEIVYQAQPLPLEIQGADSSIAASIESNQDVAEPVENSISATVDGVYVQVHSSQAVDQQLLADMTQAQVDKIRNR